MHHPITFLTEKSEQGTYVKTRLLHKNFFLIFDSDISREVLTDPRFIQNKQIFNRIKPVTGDRGLVQLEGRKSEIARAKVRPLFSAKNILKFQSIIRRNCQSDLVHECDIQKLMTHLVLKNAFEMFLNVREVHKLHEIGEIFKELNRLCGLRMKSLVAFPSIKIRRLKMKLRRMIGEAIQTSDSDTIDQAMTLLFAGHETTASSLTFTFLLLSDFPEIQEQIARGDERAALEIYKESLRRFPPAYMLAREARENFEFQNQFIKKGDQVLIGIYQIQNQQLKGPEKDYLPFGFGNKSCVGEHLAYVEASIILQEFCRRYKFKRENEEIKYVPHITLHPERGQKLKLEERSHG